MPSSVDDSSRLDPTQYQYWLMAAENIDSKSRSKPPAGMPPGMIMGPDGKPCKVCTAFRYWKPPTTRTANSKKGSSTPDGTAAGPNSTTTIQQNPVASMMAAFATGSTVSPSSSTSVSINNASAPYHRGNEPPPGCPPDVEQLGRATWTFLHTTAAYYPEKPTPTQRANMLMLLRSLPVLYPCTLCADDFGKDIDRYPPDVSGRGALSRWLCERHNEVNEKLGKERFNCEKVDERWKDGPPDGSCD